MQEKQPQEPLLQQQRQQPKKPLEAAEKNLPFALPNESPPPDARLTRRQMLALSGLALGSLALGACSGGALVESPGGSDFSRAERLVVNPQLETITDERGVPTAFLGYLSTPTGALATFWGTPDAEGVPARLTQSLYWDSNPANGTRVLYDGQGLPVRIEHEENGAFALVFWEADRATFKLYQPDGSYIGGAVVTPSAAGYDVVQLPDSQIAGYFSGRISGLTDAIVTFTIGGTPTTPTATDSRGRGANGRSEHTAQDHGLTPQEAAQARKVVDALAARSIQTQTGFAGNLLTAIAEPLLTTGVSELGNRILATAFQGTGLSPTLLNTGLPILYGLAAPFLLRSVAGKVAQQFAEADAASTTTPEQPSPVPPALSVAYASPPPVEYRAGNAFRTTRPVGDSTGVRGIVAAREINTVPVSGVIDAAGNLYLSGTAANGSVIEMRGVVQGEQVTGGTWALKTTPTPTRDEDGNWNAEKTPIGQCRQQTSSGGQGIHERSFDLGVCGTFAFQYQAFSIPDRFTIYQDDNVIFDTGGEVSGGSTASVTAVGQTTIIRVVVTANRNGTQWNYTVGCPE